MKLCVGKKVVTVFAFLVSAQLAGYCTFGTYEAQPGSSFVGDFDTEELHGDRATFDGAVTCHKKLSLTDSTVKGLLTFEGRAGEIRGSHIDALVFRKSDNSIKPQVVTLGGNSVIDVLQNDTPIIIIVDGSEVSVGGKHMNAGTYELPACPITITVVIPASQEVGAGIQRSDRSFFAKNSEWIIPTAVVLVIAANIVISRIRAGKEIFGWD